MGDAQYVELNSTDRPPPRPNSFATLFRISGESDDELDESRQILRYIEQNLLDAEDVEQNVGDEMDIMTVRSFGASDVKEVADIAETSRVRPASSRDLPEITVTPPPAPHGWRRSSIRLNLPASGDDPPEIHTPSDPPPRSREAGSAHGRRKSRVSMRRRARKGVQPANSIPQGDMRGRLLHVAPEVNPSRRFMIGVSGAASIITPRYICVNDDADRSPSAEELNAVMRAAPSRPNSAYAQASSDARASGDAHDAPAAETSQDRYNVTNVEVSDGALSAAAGGRLITILPAVAPGLVSIDGEVPTQSRAVCQPLGKLAPRPYKVSLSAASLNIDTYGIYESSISPWDKRDYVFETTHAKPELICGVYDARHLLDKLRNDGSYHGGMHVALSVTIMLMLNTIRAVGKCPRLSAAFLYYNRQTRPVYGMNARDALRAAKKIGIAEMEAYTWTGDDYYAPHIDEQSYRTARRHRVSFYAIIASVLGLKCALELTGVCYILLPLFGMRPRFWCTNSEDTRNRVLGVQSAVVLGYTHEGFILSVWGTEWVGDRTMILPYSDWDSVIECWAAPVSLDALRVGDYIGSMIVNHPPADMRASEPSPLLSTAHDAPPDNATDEPHSTLSPAFQQPRAGCTIV